jgi:hypothetical protein
MHHLLQNGLLLLSLQHSLLSIVLCPIAYNMNMILDYIFEHTSSAVPLVFFWASRAKLGMEDEWGPLPRVVDIGKNWVHLSLSFLARMLPVYGRTWNINDEATPRTIRTIELHFGKSGV